MTKEFKEVVSYTPQTFIVSRGGRRTSVQRLGLKYPAHSGSGVGNVGGRRRGGKNLISYYNYTPYTSDTLRVLSPADRTTPVGEFTIPLGC